MTGAFNSNDLYAPRIQDVPKNLLYSVEQCIVVSLFSFVFSGCLTRRAINAARIVLFKSTIRLNNLSSDKKHNFIMHQSIPSANMPPPRQPPGFCTYFQPGSRGFVPSGLPGGCPGVGPVIKVPSCQLIPHQGTFQLQTDLPSIATL